MATTSSGVKSLYTTRVATKQMRIRPSERKHTGKRINPKKVR